MSKLNNNQYELIPSSREEEIKDLEIFETLTGRIGCDNCCRKFNCRDFAPEAPYAVCTGFRKEELLITKFCIEDYTTGSESRHIFV